MQPKEKGICENGAHLMRTPPPRVAAVWLQRWLPECHPPDPVRLVYSNGPRVAEAFFQIQTGLGADGNILSIAKV